jgi:hypothetical protein
MARGTVCSEGFGLDVPPEKPSLQTTHSRKDGSSPRTEYETATMTTHDTLQTQVGAGSGVIAVSPKEREHMRQRMFFVAGFLIDLRLRRQHRMLELAELC